jgi:hypothetical protein
MCVTRNKAVAQSSVFTRTWRKKMVGGFAASLLTAALPFHVLIVLGLICLNMTGRLHSCIRRDQRRDGAFQSKICLPGASQLYLNLERVSICLLAHRWCICMPTHRVAVSTCVFGPVWLRSVRGSLGFLDGVGTAPPTPEGLVELQARLSGCQAVSNRDVLQGCDALKMAPIYEGVCVIVLWSSLSWTRHSVVCKGPSTGQSSTGDVVSRFQGQASRGFWQATARPLLRMKLERRQVSPTRRSLPHVRRIDRKLGVPVSSDGTSQV